MSTLACRPAPARATPRAIRSDTSRGQQLIEMEIPDCGCPALDEATGCINPPCKHILARGRRVCISVAEWAVMLWAYDPRGYGGPPPVPAWAWAISFTHAARIKLYQKRRGWRVQLFHPGDVDGEKDPDLAIRLLGGGPKGRRQRDVAARPDAEAACPGRRPAPDTRALWFRPGVPLGELLIAFRRDRGAGS